MEKYLMWLMVFVMIMIGCWVTAVLSGQSRRSSSSIRITSDDLFDNMERSPSERKEEIRKNKGALVSRLGEMVGEKKSELAKLGSRLYVTEEELSNVFLVRIISEESNGSSSDIVLIILYLSGSMIASYPSGDGVTEKYYQPDQIKELLSTVQTTLDTFQSEVEKKHQSA